MAGTAAPFLTTAPRAVLSQAQLGSTKEGELARAARITAGPGTSLPTRLRQGAACGWLVVTLWDGLGRGWLPPAFCPHLRASWPKIQPWSDTQGVSCTQDLAVPPPARLWGDNFPTRLLLPLLHLGALTYLQAALQPGACSGRCFLHSAMAQMDN